MTTVILINGKPRAGKDTFVDAMTQGLQHLGVSVARFSSIEPIRDMLGHAGFDLAQKTEADRKLLSTVGDAVEDHSEFRSARCFDEVQKHRRTAGRRGVVFLFIREPAIWERVKARLNTGLVAQYQPYTFLSIFIENPDVPEVVSNPSDAGVYGMTYDAVIHNDGSLDEFMDQAMYYAGIVAGRLPI
jgi:hypothetical protein